MNQGQECKHFQNDWLEPMLGENGGMGKKGKKWNNNLGDQGEVN